jgi:hypothetical protein
MTCAWCKKSLTPAEETHVPIYVKIPASMALAFMHGGMWVFKELSQPYCAPCRRKIVPLVSFFALLVLAAAAVGVSLWLTPPK